MDYFDISFACSIFSKSWEVTNYGFLGAAHLPVTQGADKTKRVSKRATVMQARKPTVHLVALGSEERRIC